MYALVAPRDAAHRAQEGFLLDHEAIDVMQHWNTESWCENKFHLWSLWPKLSPAAVVRYDDEDSNSTESIVSRE